MFNYFVLSTYQGGSNTPSFARLVRAPLGHDAFSPKAQQYVSGGKWIALDKARDGHLVSVEGGKQFTPAAAAKLMRSIAAAERDL
jgi:hypothetical protein